MTTEEAKIKLEQCLRILFEVYDDRGEFQNTKEEFGDSLDAALSSVEECIKLLKENQQQ